MRVSLAKWLLKGTDYHVHTNPGKHPETRRALNGAVSKRMDELDYVAADEVYGRKMMDAQDQLQEMRQANIEHEEYYERRRRAKR